MREGWKCPQCGKIMSPDVTEHSCGSLANPNRDIIPYPLPKVPHWSQPGTPRPGCAACSYGLGACLCVLGCPPVTCGVGVAPAFKGSGLS